MKLQMKSTLMLLTLLALPAANAGEFPVKCIGLNGQAYFFAKDKPKPAECGNNPVINTTPQTYSTYTPNPPPAPQRPFQQEYPAKRDGDAAPKYGIQDKPKYGIQDGQMNSQMKQAEPNSRLGGPLKLDIQRYDCDINNSRDYIPLETDNEGFHAFFSSKRRILARTFYLQVMRDMNQKNLGYKLTLDSSFSSPAISTYYLKDRGGQYESHTEATTASFGEGYIASALITANGRRRVDIKCDAATHVVTDNNVVSKTKEAAYQKQAKNDKEVTYTITADHKEKWCKYADLNGYISDESFPNPIEVSCVYTGHFSASTYENLAY